MILSNRILHNLSLVGPYLQSYFHLQLVITLCSWPMLYAAGLPLSPALFLGNLLFGPVLSSYLFLCSVLFFLQLANLPTFGITSLLELLSSSWCYLISPSSRSWLGILNHPPGWWVLLMPLITSAIISTKRFSKKIQLMLLGSLLVVSGSIIPRIPFSSTSKLAYFSKELTLHSDGSQAIIIDPGILGSRFSAEQQVTFRLLPQLRKQGISYLKAVILSKPSIMVFKAATRLIEQMPVEQLYLPAFSASYGNNGWCAWERLLTAAQQYNTKITQLTTSLRLTLGSHALMITKQAEPTKKNHLIYHHLIVQHGVATHLVPW